MIRPHRVPGRRLFAVLAVALALWCAVAAPAPAAPHPWLLVSDIHLRPGARRHGLAPLGSDTNPALLASAIEEMRRVDPDPPVVVIPGDFFAHKFDYRRADATMDGIVRSFDAAFPHAQFLIALGNEDSGCGDYQIAPGSPFLKSVANAWAPLVNRRGAAPDFARTFPREGFYTARLPGGIRAVIIDDTFLSPRYRTGCGASDTGAAATLDDLERALRAGGTAPQWVILHIPPGIDGYSTVELTHHLAIVPFLDPAPRERLLALIADPAHHVALVLAGHTHKFSYRIIERPDHGLIPLLTVPSVSPIFRNAPAFLTADVDPGGVLANVEDYALVDGNWRDIGGLPALGVTTVTGEHLAGLQRRLETSPALRAIDDRLYESGAPPEIGEWNWRDYWCVATTFSATTYRACVGESGFSVFTRRGIWVFGLAGAVALLFIAGFIVAVRRSRRAA